ncbi:hypothetical protein NDN08_003837 [Rhodosorus marinus]|uniref:Plasma membrane ATPase n=1 Tax=Rhodosorus marinus TaxID=101924 RepID=A0AAV8UI06_9RHOD|nr:hypothetical protein NDN08_003837 [Rhodosorus marinus]
MVITSIDLGSLDEKMELQVSPDDLKVDPEFGLTEGEAKERMEAIGPNELPKKKRNKFMQFLSFFMNPLSYIMELAAILAISVTAIGGNVPDYPDFIGIVFLLVVNATIGFVEETKAGDAVDALMASLSPEAKVKRDGQWKSIDARELVPGDIIAIKLGDIVPADAKVIAGENVKADQSAMTGESLPVSKEKGDLLYSGCVIKMGECEALVVATGPATFFGRAAALVDEGGPSNHFQIILVRIGLFCVGLITIFTIAIIIVMWPVFQYSFNRGINNVLVLLIGGVPIAMPTVLSVTMSVGAHSLAKFKAIVTRITAVEEMAGMDILCSDKTGTLTKNKLEINLDMLISYLKEYTVHDVMVMAARAARTENQDAIDFAIVNQLSDPSEARKDIKEVHFMPFDPISKRTQITYVDEATGKTMRSSKGAPQIIRDICKAEGDFKKEIDQAIDDFAGSGYRALGVCVAEVPEGTRSEELPDCDWTFVGMIPIYDPPRDDSAETIQKALDLGVQVKMITGDQLAIGKETARLLGMGTNMYNAEILSAEKKREVEMTTGQSMAEVLEGCDGVAGVMPEDKYEIVKELIGNGHVVGMTGDGVNDAPALKRANIGVAVADATDAARSAADIVLTESGLSVIITAIIGARKIFQRMKNYALLATATTVRVVVSFSILIFAWKYDQPPFLVLLLALLNDGTIMTISTDRVQPSKVPDQWRLGEIFFVAVTMGLYLTISTLLFFHIVFETDFPQTLGLEAPWLDPESSDFRNPNAFMLHSLVYMQVSISGQALIFSTRSTTFWFMERPSVLLMLAFVTAQLICTFLGVYADFGFTQISGVGWGWAAFVWVYNLCWFLPIDIPKHFAKALLHPEAWLHSRKQHFRGAKRTDPFRRNSISSIGVDAARQRASIESTLTAQHRNSLNITIRELEEKKYR